MMMMMLPIPPIIITHHITTQVELEIEINKLQNAAINGCEDEEYMELSAYLALQWS